MLMKSRKVRQKGSRKTMLREVEFRWRATGNDGFISVGIWPTRYIGPSIHGNLRCHETRIDKGGGW